MVSKKLRIYYGEEKKKRTFLRSKNNKGDDKEQVDKKEEIWTVMKKIEMNHTCRSAN